MDQHARTLVVSGFIKQYTEIKETWVEAEAETRKLKVRADELEGIKKKAIDDYHKLRAAAGVFGFDLDAESKAADQEKAALRAIAGSEEPVAPPTPMPPAAVEFKTIREHALAAAEAAFPNPIRASGLRQQLEALGIKTHEKTVGMTLYRLLKGKKLRRDGWDWFWVPEVERQSAVTAQEPESSGSDPELLLNAAE